MYGDDLFDMCALCGQKDRGECFAVWVAVLCAAHRGQGVRSTCSRTMQRRELAWVSLGCVGGAAVRTPRCCVGGGMIECVEAPLKSRVV